MSFYNLKDILSMTMKGRVEMAENVIINAVTFISLKLKIDDMYCCLSDDRKRLNRKKLLTMLNAIDKVIVDTLKKNECDKKSDI